MVSLSIIIPTKNRYTTLFPVVTAITSLIKDSELEIIIQDNSDNNQAALDFINKLADSRVKYFYTCGILPISDNTEMAIKNVTKDYVCFIGDDDFVTPYIMSIVSEMDKRGIESLNYDCGHYWWDSVEFVNRSAVRFKSAFWTPKSSKEKHVFQKKDSKKELRDILRFGAVIIGDMPRVYHGLVSRRLLEQIKSVYGRYVIASCPDICLATSLSHIIDYHYHLNYPVTVCGASKNSAAGLGARNAHFAKLEDVPFLRPNIIDRWDPNIPKVWSPGTTYVQAVSEVLTELSSSLKINYAGMFLYMLKNESNLMHYIKPALKKYVLNNPLCFFSMLNWIIRKLLIRNAMKTEIQMYDVKKCTTIKKCMSEMPKLSME